MLTRKTGVSAVQRFVAAIAFAVFFLGISLSSVFAAEKPVVVHASWRANPGEVLGFYGGSLIAATAKDSTTSVVALPLTGNRKSLSPQNATVRLSVLNAQENLVQALLPAKTPRDLYVAWVRTSAGWSDPVWINRAEPWWLSERRVYAGQPVRLFGRNFLHPAMRPNNTISERVYAPQQIKLELVNLDNGTRLPVTKITEATDFTVDFLVPTDIAVGAKYSVRVTNGAGGEYGWAQLPGKETCTAVAGQADPLGLNAAWTAEIPWSQRYNVKDFGVKADGKTDDTAALQAALDAAGKAGGGVVYLPAGSYAFAGLTIPARTVLLGQGKDITKLKYNGVILPGREPALGPGAYGWSIKLIYCDAYAAGVAKLMVESTVERPQDDDRRRINGWVTAVAFEALGKYRESNGAAPAPSGYFLKDVRLRIVDGGGVMIRALSEAIIEDCDIDISHGPIDGSPSDGYIRIRNSVLRNTQRPGISGVDDHAWIEGNTLIGTPIALPGRPVDIAGTAEHRVTDFGPDSIYFGGNRVDGSWGKPNSNEGEGVCWQCQRRLAFSRATTADATSLTDTTQTWAEDSLTNAEVVIIAGRGLGQMRNITAHSANRLVVDTPWQIVPDKTSVYTVDPSVVTRNLIVGNEIIAKICKGGIALYTKDYDNVIVDNNLRNTGGIWLTSTQVLEQKRADFSYFAYVARNSMSGVATPPSEGNGKGNHITIGPGVDGGIVARPELKLPAVGVYGHEIRRNLLVGIGTDVQASSVSNAAFVKGSGIYVSSPSTLQVPMAQGLIIERNRVLNTIAGVHLNNTSYDTVLYGNIFDGNGMAIDDNQSVRTIILNDK